MVQVTTPHIQRRAVNPERDPGKGVVPKIPPHWPEGVTLVKEEGFRAWTKRAADGHEAVWEGQLLDPDELAKDAKAWDSARLIIRLELRKRLGRVEYEDIQWCGYWGAVCDRDFFWLWGLVKVEPVPTGGDAALSALQARAPRSGDTATGSNEKSEEDLPKKLRLILEADVAILAQEWGVSEPHAEEIRVLMLERHQEKVKITQDQSPATTMPLTETFWLNGQSLCLVLAMDDRARCRGLKILEGPHVRDWMRETVAVLDLALGHHTAWDLIHMWADYPGMHCTLPVLRQVIEIEEKREGTVIEGFQYQEGRV